MMRNHSISEYAISAFATSVGGVIGDTFVNAVGTVGKIFLLPQARTLAAAKRALSTMARDSMRMAIHSLHRTAQRKARFP